MGLRNGFVGSVGSGMSLAAHKRWRKWDGISTSRLTSLLLVCLLLISCETASAVHFRLNQTYSYEVSTKVSSFNDISDSFAGFSGLPHQNRAQSVGKFHLDAKFDVTPYQIDEDGRMYCQVTFPEQPIIVSETSHDDGTLKRVTIPENVLNFHEHWFGFVLTEQGDVHKILADPKEHPKALEIKKGIANIFSARLHSDTGMHRRDFEVVENDLTGKNLAKYEVQHDEANRNLVYSKRSLRDEEHERMSHRSEKQIAKSIDDGAILSVTIDDFVSSHGSAGTQVTGLSKRGDDDYEDAYEQPAPSRAASVFMQTTGKTTVTLLGRRSMNGNSPHLLPPSTIETLSLIVQQDAIVQKISPQEAIRIARKSIACFDGSVLHSTTTPSHARKAKCFGAARIAMARLAEEHVPQVIQRIVADTILAKNAFVAVDLAAESCALSAGVADVLFRTVFGSTKGGPPVADSVKESALQALGKCKGAPTTELLDAVSEIAFNGTLNGQQQRETVAQHGLLSLGHMSRKAFKAQDEDTSRRIMEKLQNSLEKQDPAQYAALAGTSVPLNRNRLSKEPFDREGIIASKKAANHANILAALGATQRVEAFRNIVDATVPDSKLPVVVQTTAARALGHYKSKSAENFMLMVASVHPYAVVRQAAAVAYKVHKREFTMEDVASGIEELQEREGANASEPLSTKARRASELVSFIQTETSVKFHLQTPSFSWEKKFGADLVGVRASLKFQNSVDLLLSVLQSRLTIDVSDSAGAFLYVDIGGYLELPIFDAELQFHAEVGYDMDMLKDFKLSDITNIAELFDKFADDVKTKFEEVRSGLTTAFLSLSTAFSKFKKLTDGTGGDGLDFTKFSFKLPLVPANLSLDDVDDFNSVLMFFKDIEDKIVDFGKEVKTAVVSGVEPVIQVIPQAIADIFAGVAQFLDCPQQASTAIVLGVEDVEKTIHKVEDAVTTLKGLFSLTALEGRLPDFEDEFFDSLKSLATQFKDQLGFIDPLLDAYTKIMDMGTKLQAEFVQALHIFKEWTAKLRSAYDKIKTFIDSVFGAKFAKQFPSKPASFQDVALVFPNNTYGTYNGTSLLAAAGTPIVAPMAGVVSKVSSDIVRLEVTENSLRNYYIFLGHVSLAAGVTGPVKKNATIGTVTTGQSTIHVSIQHKLTKRFIDPAKYLPRRMPGILGNGFKPDPNFYSLTVVGKQIVPPTAIIDLNSLRSVNKTGRTSTKARRGFEADIGQDRSLARRDLLSDLGLPEFNVKIPNVCTDDEFQNAPEICGGGMLPEFRRSLLLFKTKQFFLVAGFVPVTFELQFDAVMGIQAGVSVCLIGLEVKPKVTPEFGVAMQGSLSVGAFIEITLLARGTVADTHVPIAVFFPLAKFPIGTCIQINVEILPLQLEVSVGVEIDFVFFSKSWFVTIVRLTLDKITFLVTDTCPQPDSRQLPPKDSGTIVDVTAPIVHQLSISQVANVPTSAPLLFARFSIGDPESGIANASIAVGWNPGDSTVAAPVLIPRDQGESITIPGLADISLFDEKTLYVTITVFNQHQMMTKQSQKLVWDLSPPVIKIAEIFTPFAQYTFPIGKNETRTALRKAMQTFKYDLTQQIGGGALQGFSDRLDFSYVIQDATAQSTLEYAVGTGAAPDLITSLRDWTELPATQTQGTLAFDSLQLSHGVTYHLALRSLNALGYESTTLSSGTLIDLTPPVVGSIFMGPTLRQNWNATNVITNAVFNFFGFSDAESDVAYFNYAIGPNTTAAEMVPSRLGIWTPFGSWTSPVISTGGATSDVNAQIGNLRLPEGNHTICVQVTNWVGMQSMACQNGYVVDTTPPKGSLWLEHGNDPASPGDIIIHFEYTDNLSGVQYVRVGLGDGYVPIYKEFFTIEVPTNPNTTTYMFTIDQSLAGVLIYGQLNLVDFAGNQFFTASEQPIKVDFFPPIAGSVFDGPRLWIQTNYIDNATALSCSWTAFIDTVNGIGRSEVSFGFSPGLTDVILWQDVPVTAFNTTLAVPSNVTVGHRSIVFCNVRAWNNNGNASQATVNSGSGTLVDLTAPLSFNATVKTGGLSAYQFQRSYISLEWTAAQDGESGIAEYRVSVTDYSNNNTLYEDAVVDYQDPRKLSTVLFGVPLFQGSRFYATITAYNGASNTTASRTQVVTIDETSPILQSLSYLGRNSSGLALYVTDRSSVPILWSWEDPESGIDPTTIKCLLFQMINGEAIEVPGANANATLQGCTIRATPALVEGTTYIVSAAAGNGAGLVSTAELPLKIVINPPKFVSAGTGSSVIGQTTLPRTTDHGSLRGWFTFQDAFAPITGYEVAFGSGPGLSDYAAFTTVRQPYVVVPHPLIDEQVYFMSVRAINAAGLVSGIRNLTEGTTVKPGARPGVVFIGPDPKRSVDFQAENDVLSATFNNFTHSLPGAFYEWSLGTIPGGTDLVDYTTECLLIPSKEKSGQILYSAISLSSGQYYYLTVRATFGGVLGTDIISVTSNAFRVIDQALPKPIVNIATVSKYITNQTSSIVPVSCSTTADSLGSAIGQLSIVCGTARNHAEQVSTSPNQSLTTTAEQTSATLSSVLDLGEFAPGAGIFCRCVAVERNTGFVSSEFTGPLAIDSTPPIPPADLICSPAIVSPGSPIFCDWGSFVDAESGIDHVEIALGTSPGGSEITNRINVTGTYFVFDSSKYSMDRQTARYFVTLWGTNSVGLQTPVITSVNVDFTEPLVSPENLYVVKPLGRGLQKDTEGFFIAELEESTDCLRETSRVQVRWDGVFNDPESGMKSYRIAIKGRRLDDSLSPGEVLLDWVEKGNATSGVFNLNKRAVHGMQLSVILQGTNVAGLTSMVESKPVGVANQGPKVLWVGQSLSNTDDGETFSLDSRTISVEWQSQHICAIVLYRWSIFDSLTGEPAQPEAFTTQTRVTASNLRLAANRTYIVRVQAYDSLHIPGPETESNGITIIFQPPYPGRVYDGPFFRVDIDETRVSTSLSASWDDMSTPTCAIRSYSVSFGTNYRDASGDVFLLTNVGLNTSVSFELSTSLPSYVSIYTTVQAVTCQGNVVSAVSNGFSIGERPPPSKGYVWLDNGLETKNATAQSSTTTVTINWESFHSTWSPLQYYVALSSSANPENPTQFRNVSTITTTYTFANLSLNVTTQYYAFVKAVDASFQSVIGSCSFIVDVVPPKPGHVSFPSYSASAVLANSELMWTSEATSLEFLVSNVSASTGIFALEYAVVNASLPDLIARRDTAGIGSNPSTVLVDNLLNLMQFNPETVIQPFQSIGNFDQTAGAANISVATTLTPSGTYRVLIGAINGAGVKAYTLSAPLRFDPSHPVAGTVNLGSDVTVNQKYSAFSNESQITWLEAQDEIGMNCPRRFQDFRNGSLPAWMRYTRGPGDFNLTTARVNFRDQCAASNSNGLSLRGSSSNNDSETFSGCEVLSSIYASGSSFSFRMKASNASRTVSTIILANTDQTVLERDYWNTTYQTLSEAPAYSALGFDVYADAPGVLVVWTTQQGDKIWRGKQVSLTQNATSTYLRYTVAIGQDASRIVVTDDSGNAVGSVTTSGLAAGPIAFPALPKVAPRFRLWSLGGVLTTNATMSVSEMTYPLNTTHGCNYGEPWNDLESGIHQYEIAIGTQPGQTDVLSFTQVDAKSIQPNISAFSAGPVNLRPSELVRLGMVSSVLPTTVTTINWCKLNATMGGCSPLASCAQLAAVPLGGVGAQTNVSANGTVAVTANGTNANNVASISVQPALPFTCACPPGYEGDGVGFSGCRDVDECAVALAQNVSLCGKNAHCTNLPGSYMCSCDAGFAGTNPYSSSDGCSDVDECAISAANQTTICGNSGCCQNLSGSYTCQCYEGFRRIDQWTCVDIDECATGQHKCNKLATCVNTLGGYQCLCPSGKVGSGVGLQGCSSPDPELSCAGAAPLYIGTNTTGSISGFFKRSDKRTPVSTFGNWYKLVGTGDQLVARTQRTPQRKWDFFMAAFGDCFFDAMAVSVCSPSVGQCTLQLDAARGQPVYILVLDEAPVNYTISLSARSSNAGNARQYQMLPRTTRSGRRCIEATSNNQTWKSGIPGPAPGLPVSPVTPEFKGCLNTPRPWINSGIELRGAMEGSLLTYDLSLAACATKCSNFNLPFFSYQSAVKYGSSSTSSVCVCMPNIPPGSMARSTSSCSYPNPAVRGDTLYTMSIDFPLFQVALPPMWCGISETCKADGSLNKPTDTVSLVAPRRTTTNQTCVLPFLYNATLQTDCVSDIAGRLPWCFVDIATQRKASCNEVDWCSAVPTPLYGRCISGNTTTPSYRIQCDTGFAYNAATQSCVDYDECLEGTDTCEPLATCVNTFGGYSCICDDTKGYVKMNDRCFYDPARFNISGAPAGSITPDPDINPAKYYVGLKAINRAGLEAIKWSDQMTIDTEPPQLQSLDFMRNGDNVTVISSQNISLAWAAGDSVSGILFYDFALGTTPFSNDLYAWTRTNATGANFTTTAPLPAEGGRVCVSLNATDGALNMNSTVTCATVQTHPPDNASASVRLQMHGRQIAWTGFIESATSIAYYEVSVSSGNSGAPDVLPWTAISFSDRVESAIIFGPNASYLLPTNKRTILSPLFYRVRATNLGSLSSEVSTRAAYYLGTDSMLLAPRENNSAMIKGFQDETIGLSVATLLPATSEHAILVVPLTANVGYVPDSFGGLPLPPPLLVLRAGGKYGRYKRAEAAILSVTKDGNINSGSFVVVNGTFTSNDNATDVKSFAVYGVRVTGGQWVGVKSIANSAQRSLNFTATFGGMYALYVNETVPTFVDLNLDGLPDILYTQDSPSHRLRRKEEEAEEVSTIDDPAETTVKRQKRAPVSFVPTTYGYWPSTSYLMNATFQSPTLTSTMTIVSLCDLDADLVTDAIIYNSATNLYRAWLLKPNGTLKAEQAFYSPPLGPRLLGFADLDLNDRLASVWVSRIMNVVSFCFGSNFTLPCTETVYVSASGTPVGLGAWGTRIGFLSWQRTYDGFAFAIQNLAVTVKGTAHQMTATEVVLRTTLQDRRGQTWAAYLPGDMDGDGYTDMLLQCTSPTATCGPSGNLQKYVLLWSIKPDGTVISQPFSRNLKPGQNLALATTLG